MSRLHYGRDIGLEVSEARTDVRLREVMDARYPLYTARRLGMAVLVVSFVAGAMSAAPAQVQAPACIPEMNFDASGRFDREQYKRQVQDCLLQERRAEAVPLRHGAQQTVLEGQQVGTAVMPVLSEDSLAMVALYNSTDGPNWENNTNWLTGPLSTWHGVSVDEGRVRLLDLRANRLSGPIPTQLGDLSGLRDLWLQDNQLTGPIPPELGGLSSLWTLILGSNRLSGPIPPELGNLTTLINLNLSANELSDTIPSELGRLSSLEQLYLYNNQLSGLIPPQIGNLSHLWQLDLSANELSGPIPAELGALNDLWALTLSSNQLSGPIPPQFGDFTELTWLELSNNEISGAIPPQITNLTELTWLDLGGNQLGESMPSALGNLSSLLWLLLNDNQLSGTIPPQLGNLSNLLQLDLRSNELSGPIPPALGDLTELLALDLSANHLSAAIPPQIGNLTELTWLDLSKNQLSGPISPALGNFTELFLLQLSGNQLSGAIPPQLGNLARLWQLDLSDNQLSGTIPPQLGNLPELSLFQARGNQLSGSIPSQLGNLASLWQLDLSGNQLSGSIPPQFGNLSRLEGLYLTDNQLSGSIPPELGALTGSGIVLHLDNNQFSGSIPPELSNITELRVLNLAHNRFSGTISPEFGFIRDLSELYLNYNQFSGPVPLSFTNLANLEVFHFENTSLCESFDVEFQNWIQGVGEVRSTGILCEEAPTITIVSDGAWRSSGQFFEGWQTIHFDDADWPNARAPFPQSDGCVVPEEFPDPVAEVIWHDPGQSGQGPEEVFLRRSFALNVQQDVRLFAGARIWADDDFAFYVNDSRVYLDDSGAAGPLVTIDFAPYLQDGLNVLAIHAVDGEWENPHEGACQAVLFSAIISVDDTPLKAEVTDGLPDAYALEQNYPNPFNPTTTIRFRLVEQVHVRLDVYDALGRLVAAMINEEMLPGAYQIEWNGRDGTGVPMQSGVYFYHIQTGHFTETRKMTLIR